MKNAARQRPPVPAPRERNRSVTQPAAAATRGAAPAAKNAAAQLLSKNARSEMEGMFDRLHAMDRSAESDSLTGKGLAQLFADTNVSAASMESMVLLWKLGATQQGCVSRQEWLTSMYSHGIDSALQLKQRVVEWAKDVREHAGSFLLMYNYLYDYIRGEEDRRMSLANATSAWDIFFAGNTPYTKWKAWAAANVKGDVSRDLWRQLGIFFTLDDGAVAARPMDDAAVLPWPSAIADFVDATVKRAE